MIRFKPLAALFILTTTLQILCGCAADDVGSPERVNDAASGISDALARAEIRTEEITEQAKKLPPLPPRAEILRHADGVRDDLGEGNEQLAAARAAMADMANEMHAAIKEKDTRIAVLESELRQLNQAWVGPRAWSSIRWAIIIFLVAGVISTATGIMSPRGWGLLVSRVINTNIMLPFVLIRDLYFRFRGLKVTTAPAGTK